MPGKSTRARTALVTAARSEYLEKVGRKSIHRLLFDKLLPYPRRLHLAARAAALGKNSGMSELARALNRKADADAFAADRREDVKQFGVPWATLTPLQRGEIQVHLDRLKRAGWTLRDAVDFTLEHCKAPPLPLQTLAAQCLRAKEAKGCRPRSPGPHGDG